MEIQWIAVSSQDQIPFGINILVRSYGEYVANVYRDEEGFFIETFGGFQIEYTEEITHYANI